MDPFDGAYGRIRLFLTDLNLVLGSLPAMTCYGTSPDFNHIAFPKKFDHGGLHHRQLSSNQSQLDRGVFNQSFLPNRSTKRSRAWKKNHGRRCQPHHLPSVPPRVRYMKNDPQDQVISQSVAQHPASHPIHNYRLPRSVDRYSVQGQPNKQYQAPLPAFVADHPLIDGVEHNEPGFNGPDACQDVHEEFGLGFDMNNKCDDLDNECPNNLDEHVYDLSEQEQASETTSDNRDPEVQPKIVPESNDPQVPEPAFDMANYSAKDVNRWARTLSADQFEELRILGPESRIESFRQYAISNLDRPTRTLSSSIHEHLEQLVPPSIGNKDNSDYSNCQPNDTNKNNSYQQQLNYQVDNFESNFYNDLDGHDSQLEENLDGSVGFAADNGLNDGSSYDNGGFDDGGFDDGVFEDGGFDNGGFDDGGFDDGSFDDGGFDDGGFDSGGFDDGGFDDGGFDDGGFDDGGFDDGGFDDAYY
ncbi:hypothetical protein PGT21_031754 [Puccinia graminis f. sp. tritici]|uniref:Uncharacterized protein n=1 Tax=Puccinia graminis f. sp. tritici TaxID=56615 RepID=A0A5B0PVH7_PUCGR|nr:hypothetical protein PGT21_031754 [Puccinia graminis f. sp. tritici]